MAVMKIFPCFHRLGRSGPNATLQKLGRDNGGSVAVIAAIVFPVLIGGMGLGSEVGLWYVAERKLQSAADVAAYAAAVRLNNGDAKAKLDEVALNASVKSGFNKARGTITGKYSADFRVRAPATGRL
jgi:Flp pilus assembly protein TadG